MPTELHITYRGMQVFAHPRLNIRSGPLMPGLEIISMASFINVKLRQFLCPITLKGLMFFTITYIFSSIPQNCRSVCS